MIDFVFLTFAFTAGLIGFFAPCSIAILPGYLLYYFGKQEEKSRKVKLLRGFKFGLIASFGFFTIFGLAGLLVLAIGNQVKQYIPWIAIITGFVLILIGILMLFKKNLTLNIPNFIKTRNKKTSLDIYLFGVAYAIAALGCTFPVFLTVVVGGIVTGSFIASLFPLLAYIIAMSLIMILVTTLAVASKSLIFKHLNKIIPHIKRISAIILILAGIYMIYYQQTLVL